VPSTPDAPKSQFNSDGSITIKWTPSSGGGTPTAYTIAIKMSDGNYSSDMANCDGSNSVIVIA
jgi:hypothetical protein